MKRRPGKRVARGGAKAFAFNTAGVSWEFMLPGTAYNYAREVGDGLRSSVVSAALCWLMRAFPEAPIVVERRKPDADVWERKYDHDLEKLLESPNAFYDGRVLMMATAMDFAFGEAFWLKVRNGADKVKELWWIPRALITPKPDENDPTVFIDHYEYQIGASPQKLAPRDVVHFRFGMDPLDIRRGFSQLNATFREVYVDDQAANFTASILRNLGVLGLVFSPKAGSPPIPPGKLNEFKEYIQQNFTGDKRGQAMAFSQGIDAHVLQYNLQGFDVGPIRDISEERVCAALGIPAAVIGFGTGLQQTKVGATMREMIQLAWRGSLMPMQKIIASEIKRSLLGDFQANDDLFRVRFDASKIHALWEDDSQKAARIKMLVDGSILTVGQGLRELGYPEPAVDYYLRLVTMQAVPASDPMAQVARVTETATAAKPVKQDIVEDPGKQKPEGQGGGDGGE